MNTPDMLLVWSDSPGLSLAIWLGIGVFALYLARNPAHQLIRSTSRMLRNGMRLASRSIHKAEQRLAERNKEVILAIGKESTGMVIEREFQRINAVVARDISGYPAVHRQISETIGKLEEDYRNAADVPPLPPPWLDAVNSIAKIRPSGDASVGRILDSIRDTVETAHQETLTEYRKSTRERHGLLTLMLPSWRKLSESLTQVKSTIDGLEERATFIDEKMKTYEQICAGDDRAAQMLSSSSLTQFFISGLVLLIAILGGVINFQLIALPMSEMVGGTSQLGPVRTADVAAMVIIMVEVAMGLFLLESLRITRLFPVIGSMDDIMRKRMIVITFSILAILAGIEASLAYMRDLLALDREAITQSLTAGGVVEAQFRWIPSIGQMVMGFILPFTLAFVAIPLESFIHSLRTVLGLTVAAVLRCAAFMVRLLGNVADQSDNVVIGVYDLIIMLPLRLEQTFSRWKMKPDPKVSTDLSNEAKELKS